VRAYASTTSVALGESIDFHLSSDSGASAAVALTVAEFATNLPVGSYEFEVGSYPAPDDPAADYGWPTGFTLTIPDTWSSGVYVAEFGTVGSADACSVYFVVRPGSLGSASVLVAVPFPTFVAYACAGHPGASPYLNEQPDRASKVSLRRPVPMAPTQWEVPLLIWLASSGYQVDYCSGFDLDDDPGLLDGYQLLVCIGHDEYWTARMRDSAERFLARGGNIAIFSGNTCWWQFRREDDGQTFVCYRDAYEDPMAGVDNRYVTVEWSSAPVNRPENTLTGASFRRGAGCWENTCAMADAAYVVTFAEHWVFAGTGLADGDTFGRGIVGYETDAADTVEDDGITRITGRDGTPPSFVVLARADLSSWRGCGQGGAATMGIFRAPGGGTVFNAATTGWGAGLGPPADPVVEQITRNVLTRLSSARPGRDWEIIGEAIGITAMAACGNKIFAADTGNRLWARDPVGQNLHWTHIGDSAAIHAIAAPREAMAGRPIGLYAVTESHILLYRNPSLYPIDWTVIGTAPGVHALAASYEWLFGATDSDDLVCLPLGSIAPYAEWNVIGSANNVVAMTNLNGRLFCVTSDRTLWTRKPVPSQADWSAIGTCPADPTGLAAYAGKLVLSTTTNQLWWRDV